MKYFAFKNKNLIFTVKLKGVFWVNIKRSKRKIIQLVRLRFKNKKKGGKGLVFEWEEGRGGWVNEKGGKGQLASNDIRVARWLDFNRSATYKVAENQITPVAFHPLYSLFFGSVFTLSLSNLVPLSHYKTHLTKSSHTAKRPFNVPLTVSNSPIIFHSDIYHPTFISFPISSAFRKSLLFPLYAPPFSFDVINNNFV